MATSSLLHTWRRGSEVSLLLGTSRRGAGGLSWVLLLLLCLLFGLGSGFNLNTTAPLLKEGAAGSFFGFSTALHQQLTPEAKSWVLVGAPRSRGVGAMKNIHPGALYRCPITAEEYDCERVDIDGEVSLDRESKDNQWLGVTVKSQGIGGKVVTCAHLYELRQRVSLPSETRDPIGRCYVLSEDLTERDDLDGGEWKFCEGRPQGHEQFGFCQQGMAASFTPDKNFILFGAPGTYNWKGEMRVQLLNLTVLELGYYDDGPYEVAGEKELNAGLIPVPYHSYLGFSVDSAMGLMSRRDLTFVAGAPRANHTGAVVLLRKDNVYRLVPQHILWGEELASSFGYSVATADLNSDGWTDLIVGAPNFFDRKAEIGGAVYVYLNPAGHWDKVWPLRLNGTYDSMFGMTVNAVGDLDQDGYVDIAVGAPFDGDGKVFIYRGSKSGLHTKPSQVLDGASHGVTRFGYSISGGLDVDHNQYPDLAVGSLSDKVVLYRSSPVVTIVRDVNIEPQVIDMEQQNCKGRDGICVEVKACFLYTAHPASYNPRITLTVVFEADTERRKLGLPHRVMFLGRAPYEPEYLHTEELKLHGQGHSTCQDVTFQVKDNIRDKLRPIAVTITHSITHTHHHRHIGPAHLAMLTPVLSPSVPETLLSDVNFLREGCGPDKVCHSNLQISCAFGTRVDPMEPFERLPLDEDGLPLFTLTDQKYVFLEVLVTNFPSDPLDLEKDGDDAHAAKVQFLLPNPLYFSRVWGHNQQVLCETSLNGSQVDCELGNPFKRDAMSKFYIALDTTGITVETTELSVDVIMSTISEQLDLAPVTVNARVVILLPLSVSGQVNTTSEVNTNQLFFSGTVKGETAMNSIDEIGSPVDVTILVTSTGQTRHTLGSAFLNIMWPLELDNGKWLLYPVAVVTEGSSLGHCIPAEALNPRRIGVVDEPQPANINPRRNGTTLSSGVKDGVIDEPKPANIKGGKRKPRSYPEHEGEVAVVRGQPERTTPAVAASERRKSLMLDCLLGSARCVLFRCPLQSVSGTESLTIKARLWNSTFIEEFSTVSVLDLVVRANITVKSTIKHLVLQQTETEIALKIFPEFSLADQSMIPWWIILIAILVGILVLTLLVLMLWMCGFFKRQERRPNYETEYYRARLGLQPSEAEKQATELE